MQKIKNSKNHLDFSVSTKTLKLFNLLFFLAFFSLSGFSQTTDIEEAISVNQLIERQNTFSQTMPSLFTNYYGDTTQNHINKMEYVAAEDAFYAVGGRYDATDNLLGGVFLKLNGQGDVIWTKNYSTTVSLYSFAQTDDGNFILSGRKGISNDNYSIYLAKVDTNGNLLQDKTFARTGRLAKGIIDKSLNDPLGETYMINYWKSNGSAIDDIGVFKIDANLNVLWSYDYNYNQGFYDEEVRNKISLNGGGSLLAGYTYGESVFLLQLDENGQEVQSKKYNITSNISHIVQTQDGGFVFIGNDFSNKAQVIKVDANLDIVWAHEHTNNDNINYFKHSDLVEDIHGDLYVTDYLPINGENRLSVLKYTSDGNLIWSKYLGGLINDTHITSSTRLSHMNTNPDFLILNSAHSTTDGFGYTDIVTMVLDTDLNSCETMEYTATITPLSILSDILENLNISPEAFIEDTDGIHTDLIYHQIAICSGLTFQIAEECAPVGSMVSIPVYVQNFTEISSFQYTIHLDPMVASITGVSNFNLTDLNSSNFNIDDDTGTIQVAWADFNSFGISVADDTPIFTIDVHLLGSGAEISPITIDGTPTAMEATQVVNNNIEFLDINIVEGEICIDPNVSISGHIKTVQNNNFGAVEVIATENGGTVFSTLTDNLGNYTLSVPAGLSYTLTAVVENSNPLDGVLFSDVLLIHKHIISNPSFGNAYKVIAADVNDSEGVTNADRLEIQQLILSIDNAFPNNKSWGFIPNDHVFGPDANDPFPVPQQKVYLNLNQNMLQQDFTAVKYGDVNNSASQLQQLIIDDRFSSTVVVQMGNQQATNSSVTIPVTVQNFTDISSFTFSLDWDDSILELVSVGDFGLAGMTDTNFGTPAQTGDPHRLNVGWYNTQTTTLAQDAVLFTMTFNISNPPSSVTTIDACSTCGLEFTDSDVMPLPYDMQTGTIHFSTLPIELVDFKAKVIDNQHVALSWITASEQDNNHFNIERSTNGQMWTTIGKMESKGNSTSKQYYTFTDYQANLGANYYRLQQVDKNSKITYSDQRVIQLSAPTDFVLYQNPIEHQLRMSYQGNTDQQLHLKLLNTQGQLLKEKIQKVTVGSSTIEWNMAELATGVYFLKIEGQTHNIYKIVKQ